MEKIQLGNGESIAYAWYGSRAKEGQAPLLLVHGNMTSSVHFDLLIEAMGDYWPILAVDLRGFGQSTYLTPIDHLKDFASDILELLETLAVESCIALGWSTGGGVVMEMAIMNPKRIKQLIFMESVGTMGYPIYEKDPSFQPDINKPLMTKEAIAHDPVQVIPILQAYANKDKATLKMIWDASIYTGKKPEADRYEKYLEDMLTQRNLVDVDYALTRFNISDEHNGVVAGSNEAHKIQCPILMFQGNHDLVVPEAMGDTIIHAFGDRIRLVKGDFGHSPMMDQIDLVKEEIIKFISM